MQKPQFAERQYEAAAYIELARGKASPFVPTQNIEAYLGIDAAADPEKAHAIWRILGVQIPRGISLSPSLWPSLPPGFHNAIPGRYCSLFIQFKRPLYQDSARAKYHRRIGGRYFEVGITAHQQKALLELETRIGRRAVVRYASPAFWSRKDFDAHDEQRTVLANSAFIAPGRVKSHRKWMYAGPSGKMVLNPEPEDAEGEAWELVLRQMADRATRQSLSEHVRSLAEELTVVGRAQFFDDNARWLRRIAQYGRFSPEDNKLLWDLSVVSQAAEFALATWLLFLLPENDWGVLLSDDSHYMWHRRYWFW